MNYNKFFKPIKRKVILEKEIEEEKITPEMIRTFAKMIKPNSTVEEMTEIWESILNR